MSEVSEVLREFRIMMRDFFDANVLDWGEEANGPRITALREFLETNAAYRDELEESILALFLLPDDGFIAFVGGVAPLISRSKLDAEIDALGQRMPRLVRTGFTRWVREAIDRAAADDAD